MMSPAVAESSYFATPICGPCITPAHLDWVSRSNFRSGLRTPEMEFSGRRGESVLLDLDRYTMDVFEIGIDQLVPSSRILRKNDGAVARMIAAIKEYGIPI